MRCPRSWRNSVFRSRSNRSSSQPWRKGGRWHAPYLHVPWSTRATRAVLARRSNRWIGDGRPAYVPRMGSSPADVVRLISRAGGVCSIAHPGLLNRDHLVPSLAKAGLAAIEVYHPEHDRSAQQHYRQLAVQHDLAVSGGSDFHGDDHHRASSLGSVGVPHEAFIPLLQRLVVAHSVVHGGQ